MASKQTYPCFACRKAGFQVLVFLDGKDEQGKTIYKNLDMTPHQHRITNQQEQSSRYIPANSSQTETETTTEQSADIHDKLTEIIGKLQGLENKIDHLSRLLYALTGEQSHEHDRNLLG
jgi:hypothetical protein